VFLQNPIRYACTYTVYCSTRIYPRGKSVTCAGVVLYGTSRSKEHHTIFAAVGTGYT
jgi:hypothetical protein